MQDSVYYTDFRWPELKVFTPRCRYVGGDLITRHNAKVFWSTWGHTRSRTGTYGCPTLATEAKGKRIMEATVLEYLELLREMRAAP
jgi:creatinine amidohydrolase/Fe(II)-dependent formamide hydrolase-like protein